MIKGWKLEWERGKARRYYNEKFPSLSVQTGKYIKAEPYEKPTPKWSGKYYVDIDDAGSGKQILKLFSTRNQAESFADRWMKAHKDKHL